MIAKRLLGLSRKEVLAKVVKHEARKEANKMTKLCASLFYEGKAGMFELSGYCPYAVFNG